MPLAAASDPMGRAAFVATTFIAINCYLSIFLFLATTAMRSAVEPVKNMTDFVCFILPIPWFGKRTAGEHAFSGFQPLGPIHEPFWWSTMKSEGRMERIC